jgi:hypothetical protein
VIVCAIRLASVAPKSAVPGWSPSSAALFPGAALPSSTVAASEAWLKIALFIATDPFSS